MSDAAATKALDAGTKYYDYSYDNAGRAMVGMINNVNNKVSSVLNDNEPDLTKLASNLSSIVPQSAQSLAGISSAKTASSGAASAADSAKASAPSTQTVSTAKQNFDFMMQGLIASAVPTPTPPTELVIPVKDLAAAIDQTNDATELVVDRTPENIKPNTDTCTKLFDQTPKPPDILTLNPDGDLLLKPGDKQTVKVSRRQSSVRPTLS